MTKRFFLFATCGLALALTACSLFPEKDPPQVYALRDPAEVAAAPMPHGPVLPVVLRVDRPEAAPGLDTPRIAVRKEDGKLDYFADAAWPRPLPDLLQGALIDTLATSNRFRGVSSDAATLKADTLLQVTIEEFDAVLTTGQTPAVHLRYRVAIVDPTSRLLRTTLPVDVTVPAAAQEMAPVMAAFRQAAQQAMQQTLQQLGTVLAQPQARPSRRFPAR